MKFRWELKNIKTEEAERLSKNLGIGKIFGTILISRGVHSYDKAIEFLTPKLKNMHDPYLFYNMKEAVSRIIQAIRSQEKIFLYGDYDVDGITAIAVLYECLKMLRANVNYYIPDRKKEGYGLNVAAIQQISAKNSKVIITVDCGINGHKAIAEAKALGMDVIVTDHHELSETLPDAFAIINPKDPRGKYPFHGIAGVGVAFKLAWALCQELSPQGEKMVYEYRSFLLDSLGLVALGTIADVSPLLDENRVMARYGLACLENSENIGIKALKELANLTDIKPLTAEHIGFRLGPRINAMGRLGHSLDCVQLFTTRDPKEAYELAQRLDTQNQRRKTIQDKIYKQAKQQIEERGLTNKKVLVLAQEDWHLGVVGIVASRLQEEYYRPVIIIALENGEGRGSGRSIPGFHLFNALQSCDGYLLDYGGHELAAGFKIKKEHVPDLDRILNDRAEEILKNDQMLPMLDIDAMVVLQDLTWDLVRQIDAMEPFGEKNRRPVLMAKSLQVITNPLPERYGGKGEHLSFRVQQNGSIFKAIAFGKGDIASDLMSWKQCDMAFTPKRNVWGDNEYIELDVKDLRESESTSA